MLDMSQRCVLFMYIYVTKITFCTKMTTNSLTTWPRWGVVNIIPAQSLLLYNANYIILHVG